MSRFLGRSSKTVGFGSFCCEIAKMRGGGGSVPSFGGETNPLAYGSDASILPIIAVNTTDPQFVISYYLVSMSTKYAEEGWKEVK